MWIDYGDCVRFRHGGKIYYFQPGVNRVERGDHVIVETSRGVEYGMVVQSPRLASDQDIVAPGTDHSEKGYRKG